MSLSSFKSLLKKHQKRKKHSLIKHASSAHICSVFNKIFKHEKIQATSFANGTLTIITSNHAQAQNAYLKSSEWIKKTNKKLGDKIIKEIKVKLNDQSQF